MLSTLICFTAIFISDECISLYNFNTWDTDLVIITVSEELFPRGILQKTPLWRKCKLRQEVCTLGLLCSCLEESQKGHVTPTTNTSNFFFFFEKQCI